MTPSLNNTYVIGAFFGFKERTHRWPQSLFICFQPNKNKIKIKKKKQCKTVASGDYDLCTQLKYEHKLLNTHKQQCNTI